MQSRYDSSRDRNWRYRPRSRSRSRTRSRSRSRERDYRSSQRHSIDERRDIRKRRSTSKVIRSFSSLESDVMHYIEKCRSEVLVEGFGRRFTEEMGYSVDPHDYKCDFWIDLLKRMPNDIITNKEGNLIVCSKRKIAKHGTSRKHFENENTYSGSGSYRENPPFEKKFLDEKPPLTKFFDDRNPIQEQFLDEKFPAMNSLEDNPLFDRISPEPFENNTFLPPADRGTFESHPERKPRSSFEPYLERPYDPIPDLSIHEPRIERQAFDHSTRNTFDVPADRNVFDSHADRSAFDARADRHAYDPFAHSEQNEFAPHTEKHTFETPVGQSIYNPTDRNTFGSNSERRNFNYFKSERSNYEPRVERGPFSDSSLKRPAYTEPPLNERIPFLDEPRFEKEHFNNSSYMNLNQFPKSEIDKSASAAHYPHANEQSFQQISPYMDDQSSSSYKHHSYTGENRLVNEFLDKPPPHFKMKTEDKSSFSSYKDDLPAYKRNSFPEQPFFKSGLRGDDTSTLVKPSTFAEASKSKSLFPASALKKTPIGESSQYDIYNESVYSKREEIERGSSSNPMYSMFPQNVKDMLREVILRFKNGIWASEFSAEYKKLSGQELKFSHLGMSFAELPGRLPEIFKVVRFAGADDFKLFPAAQLDQEERIVTYKNSSRDGMFGKSSYEPFSVKVQRRIVQILSNNSKGIFTSDFLDLYKVSYNEEFNPFYYGFDTLEAVFIHLKDYVEMTYVDSERTLVRALSDAKKLFINQDISDSPEQKPFKGPNIIPDDVFPPKNILPKENVPKKNLNDYIVVYVSRIMNPGKFWVQLRGVETTVALDDLMDNINQFYGRPESNDYAILPTEIEVNDVLVVRDPVDKHWYRACVTGIDFISSNVEVYLLDFGGCCRVDAGDLRYLKIEFGIIPSQAFEAELAYINPIGEEWTQMAVKRFIEFCPNFKPFFALLAEYKGRNLSLCLCDTSGDTDFHVNDALVVEGFAQQSVSAPMAPGPSVVVAPPPLPPPIQLPPISFSQIQPNNLVVNASIDPKSKKKKMAAARNSGRTLKEIPKATKMPPPVANISNLKEVKPKEEASPPILYEQFLFGDSLKSSEGNSVLPSSSSTSGKATTLNSRNVSKNVPDSSVLSKDTSQAPSQFHGYFPELREERRDVFNAYDLPFYKFKKF